MRQFAIDEKLDRDSVREWVNTDRTMPVEFAALVASRTGESAHYLLTGDRETLQEGRYGLMEKVLAGKMDDQIAGEIGPNGRYVRHIGDEGLKETKRRKVKPPKNGE